MENPTSILGNLHLMTTDLCGLSFQYSTNEEFEAAAQSLSEWQTWDRLACIVTVQSSLKLISTKTILCPLWLDLNLWKFVWPRACCTFGSRKWPKNNNH